MDRQKNSSRWYLLCLALLLCFAFLAVATGTAYARYRTDVRENIAFKIREPLHIRTGTVAADEDGKESFDPYGEPVWVMEDETATLSMAVSNGIPGDPEKGIKADFSEEDQRVRLRIIAGLGLVVEDETAEVTLVTEDLEIKAKAEQIIKGSSLHNEHGDGWVLIFPDEDGKEASWILEGGKLSYAKIVLKVDTEHIDMGSIMFEPQFITEIAD